MEATHATWLMDSGLFRKNQPADRVRRAEDQVRRMGYEFHVPEVTVGAVTDGQLAVTLRVENRGVAPFYADWKPEYGLLRDGKPVKRVPGTGKLTGLLPEDKPRVWAESLDVTGVRPGRTGSGCGCPTP